MITKPIKIFFQNLKLTQL